jgi:YVTN family beta-propeller protein
VSVSVSVDPRIGSELLGYRIEALIGRGGMSTVYRAEDLRLKRNVALKLLASELAVDSRFRERFLRESQLAASIDHPHIVPIYEAGEVDGQLYIAMRYVEGSDLKQLLREEGPLDPRRTLQLLRQLADALDAAHDRGLVHRDVKPSNALLDSAEHLYLADFGLTKSASDRSALTITGRIIGTVDYAAPEQIEGKPVDGRADVYSLGCLLYECLTGEVPFLRDSELAVLWGHVHESPPKASERNPQLPDKIDSVVAQALAKDPERRYVTCGDLTEAARDALGLRDVLVVRDRRPLLLAALGVLVAAGAIAAGLALSLGGEGRPKANLAVTNNSLVRIDPQTDRVTAVTSVGRKLRATIGPVGVAVGGPTVWVYNWDDSTVSAIDPGTAEVKRTVSIGGSPPSAWVNSVAADRTGAWTLSSAAGGGVVTHAGRGFELPQAFHLKYDPLAIAVGDRDLWVAAKSVSVDAVLRVSRITGAVLASVRLPGTPISTGGPIPGFQSIAAGEGAVWAARGRIVFRIDPATTRITGRVSIPSKQVLQVAAGEGAVWILVYGSGGNALMGIDPLTLRVKSTTRSPIARGAQNESEASRLAVGRGAVWWIGGDSGIVWRVDPHTGKIVSTTRLTPPVDSFGDFEPFGIAAGAGGVWVTVTTPP